MIDSEKTISILVDADNDSFEFKGALPDFNSVSHKIVNISTNILQSGINDLLGQIFLVLEKSKLESSTHEINEISFTLAINSSAQVSLASLFKGDLSGQTGLSFKISKKPKSENMEVINEQ